jgi:O-antigen/teichoic acid export membrane protein
MMINIGILKGVKSSEKTRFFYTVGLDVAAKGIPYLLLPVYLSLMSQEEFGLYSYLIFIILSLSTLFKFGMDTAETKLFYAYKGEERGQMLFTINSIVFGFFLLLIIICVPFSLDQYFLRTVSKKTNITSTLSAVFWLNLFVAITTVFLNVYFVIAERFLLYQKYNLIRLVVTNFLVWFFLYYYHYTAPVYRLLIEGVGSLLILLPLIYLYCKNFVFKFSNDILKLSLRLGIPIFFTNLLSIISGFSDKYLIQDKKSINDLAIYNLALFLSMPVSLIFSSFHSLWMPKIFKEENLKVQFDNTVAMFKKLFLLFLSFATLIWLGVLVALQLKLIASNYSFVKYIFPFVAVAFSLECLNQLFINIMVSLGKTEFTFVINLAILVLLFSLNYWLIPKFGIIVSAVIYLLANILRVTASFMIVRWRVAIFNQQYSYK